MKARTFAVYRVAADGSGRALPVEKRAAGREYLVPAGMAGEARDGDLVAIEPLREGRLGLPPARVVETIGSVKSERAVSLIALETHHIPHVFSPATLKEAEDARPVRLSRSARGLARAAARHDRPARRQGPRRRRPCRARFRSCKTQAASSSPSPSPTSRPTFIPGMAMDRASARARQFGLFPRPGRADAAGAHLQRPLLAARARGSAGARGAHGAGRRRAQALAQVSPHHDAVRRQALLRAGPGGDRRSDGRDDRAACRHRAEAALRRLFGRQDRARASQSARSRSARAQARSRFRGAAQGRALAGEARRASADRGVHDPRQCRRRRVARSRAFASALSRPRRAERRKAQ